MSTPLLFYIPLSIEADTVGYSDEHVAVSYTIMLSLDSDRKKSISEKTVEYYNAEGSDNLHTFQFRPQPMNFEVLDRRTFTEVLYPNDIYDLSDDEVFKIYRWEYKKRFAWIKSGRIALGLFYAWSEKARKKKAECEKGEITLEEFIQWLKES